MTENVENANYSIKTFIIHFPSVISCPLGSEKLQFSGTSKVEQVRDFIITRTKNVLKKNYLDDISDEIDGLIVLFGFQSADYGVLHPIKFPAERLLVFLDQVCILGIVRDSLLEIQGVQNHLYFRLA